MDAITVQAACVVFVIMSVHQSEGQNILTGTINWRATGKTNEFAFQYRLTWSQGGNFPCNVTDRLCRTSIVSSRTSVRSFNRLPSMKWECKDGCAPGTVLSDLGDMTYTSVDSLLEDKWESGEGMFTHKFALTNSSLVHIWLKDSTTGRGTLEAEMKLDTRADIHRPNTSPSAGLLPIYRMLTVCMKTIEIFSFDGDGDFVRCRWDQPIDSNTPQLVMSKDKCELHVDPTREIYRPGQMYTYRIGLEDYKDCYSTGGPSYSKVPVQISVHIIDMNAKSVNCTGPVFIGRPKIPNGYVKPYEKESINIKAAYTVQQNNSIITSIAKRMDPVYNDTTDSKTVGGIWPYINSSWSGIYVVCAAAYSDIGVPGESSCFVALVGAKDECCAWCHLGKTCGRKCRKLWQMTSCTSSCPVTTTTSTTTTTTTTPVAATTSTTRTTTLTTASTPTTKTTTTLPTTPTTTSTTPTTTTPPTTTTASTTTLRTTIPTSTPSTAPTTTTPPTTTDTTLSATTSTTTPSTTPSITTASTTKSTMTIQTTKPTTTTTQSHTTMASIKKRFSTRSTPMSTKRASPRTSSTAKVLPAIGNVNISGHSKLARPADTKKYSDWTIAVAVAISILLLTLLILLLLCCKMNGLMCWRKVTENKVVPEDNVHPNGSKVSLRFI